jgi:beta-lactamase regulating signal transducer with metallopeptidase domain
MPQLMPLSDLASQFESVIAPWLAATARASLQGAVFIAIVAIACRVAPRIPASIRCALWWLACFKMLLDLFWISPIPLPVLRASPAATYPSMAESAYRPVATATVSAVPIEIAADSPGRPILPTAPAKPFPWLAMTAILWMAGVTWRGCALWSQFRQSRILAKLATPIESSWIRDTAQRLARRFHLSPIPRVYSSAELTSPAVLGLWEPIILLPERDLYALDNDSVRLVLAHEMAHVRRNDLWLGLVPSLAQTVLFFHPLVWLAAAEYVHTREEACDAEAIVHTGLSAHEYGELLLRFGVAARQSTALAGLGASANAKLLKRRLESLCHAGPGGRTLTAMFLPIVVLLASLGLLPVKLVAQQASALPAAAAPAPEAPAASVQPTPPASPAAQPSPPAPTAPTTVRVAPPTRRAATSHACPATAAPANREAASPPKADQSAGSDSDDDADLDLSWIGPMIQSIVGTQLADQKDGATHDNSLSDSSGADDDNGPLTKQQRDDIDRQIRNAMKQVADSNNIRMQAQSMAVKSMESALAGLESKKSALDSRIGQLRKTEPKTQTDQDRVSEQLDQLLAERDGILSGVAGIQAGIATVKAEAGALNHALGPTKPSAPTVPQAPDVPAPSNQPQTGAPSVDPTNYIVPQHAAATGRIALLGALPSVRSIRIRREVFVYAASGSMTSVSSTALVFAQHPAARGCYFVN